MVSGADRDIAITPDGSRVVYRGNNKLLVRALNQLEPTVLVDGGTPHGVFISPDGQWVGFFEGDTVLKKVAITGGPPMTVCAVPGLHRGAAWSEDGTIAFATDSLVSGLQRVNASGGAPSVLTKLDRGDVIHVWPEFLPGGKAVLFTIMPAVGSVENAQIAVLNLQTGTSKVLINGGSHALYVPTGHLVYGAAGAVRAVRFDLQRLEVVGTPTTVIEGVTTTVHGAAEMTVAANGSLAYVPGESRIGAQQTIAIVDRGGRVTPLPGLRAKELLDLRADSWSPDRTQLLFSEVPPDFHCAIGHLTIAQPAEATVLIESEFCPSTGVVSPDGRWIAYQTRQAGRPEIYVDRYPTLGNRQQISADGGSKPVWSGRGTELFSSAQTVDGC